MITDHDIKLHLGSLKSEATKKKCEWAVRVYESWVVHRNNMLRHVLPVKEAPVTQELHVMDNATLDYTLSRFVSEVRNAHGEDYPANTLYSLITSIQCYLRNDHARNVQLIDKTANTFKKLNCALNYQMKQATAKGLGIESRQAQVITAEQEEQLWNKGVLGEHSPCTLRDTLLWTIGLYFGLRGGQEHRNLRFHNSQITIKYDEHNRQYLQYTEDVSKTNQGGLAHRLIKPKVCRAYENTDMPQRCPVHLFRLYCSHCPKINTSNALYLRPLEKKHGDIWYYNQPAGRETLGNVVSKLMKDGKFEGHYTNHSLRATLATRLYEAGVDEQLIQESTGHRSVEALRNYKRTNSDQKFHVHKKARCEAIVSSESFNSCDQNVVNNLTGATPEPSVSTTAGVAQKCNTDKVVMNITVAEGGILNFKN